MRCAKYVITIAVGELRPATSATAAAASIGIAGSERGTIASAGSGPSLRSAVGPGCARPVTPFPRRNPVRPAPSWLGKTGSADQ